MKWLLVVFFITVACSSPQPRITPTSVPTTMQTLSPTVTPLPPCPPGTIFPLLCVEVTPEPGATPVPTYTPYPTYTPSPTSTPLPMIKENELFDRPVLMLTDEDLTGLMGILEQQLIQQEVPNGEGWCKYKKRPNGDIDLVYHCWLFNDERTLSLLLILNSDNKLRMEMSTTIMGTHRFTIINCKQLSRDAEPECDYEYETDVVEALFPPWQLLLEYEGY